MDSLSQSITTPLLLFCLFLIIRAVFSFLETSIAALRLFKLKELAASSESYSTLFQNLERHPHKVLITILFANSLTDVTISSLTTTILTRLNLSSGLAMTFGIGITTILILIFGEIIPKNLAKGRGEKLFRSTLWLTNLIFYVFYPLVSVLIRITDFVIAKISGSDDEQTGSEWVSSEREIQFLIDYIYEKGLIEREKTEMLQNIFELGKTPIKDIMIPSTEIISINMQLTVRDSLPIFLEHNFSRLPVWEGDEENMVGMIHLKDVLAALELLPNQPLKDLVRPMLFIPESMKVSQLLRELRSNHVHLSLVLNEHGIITGLITLEDVLEEIVGDIADEHAKRSDAKVVQLKDGTWLVDAGIPLDELSNTLQITLQAEDAITLGGFVIEQLQHMPKKDEIFSYKHYDFQVYKTSEKKVLQVIISKTEQADAIE